MKIKMCILKLNYPPKITGKIANDTILKQMISICYSCYISRNYATMQTAVNFVKCLKRTQRNATILIKESCVEHKFCQVHSFTLKTIFSSTNKSVLINKTIYFPNYIPKFVFSNLVSVEKSEIDDLATSILDKHPDYKSPEVEEEIHKIVNFLVNRGYSVKDIKEKCLDYITPQHSSLIKLLQIEELDKDFLNLMPLMVVSLASLRKAAQQAREDKHEINGFSNRLSYLSHHLETPIEDLIPALSKHSALLTMKFKRLHHKMIVLKSAEISSEDLVKDLWIFNYNEKLLTNRISAAEEAGVKLKPWMLRCSGLFFTSMLNKNSETQRILSGDDIKSYLSKKLDCNKEYVDYMMEKNKLLKRINIPKIDQVITFLFEKGYTPQEIRLFPRVFCSSLETLEKRFEQYRNLRSTLPTISQLSIASKRFRDKVEKLSNKEC